jgi:hypothetical protein
VGRSILDLALPSSTSSKLGPTDSTLNAIVTDSVSALDRRVGLDVQAAGDDLGSAESL